MVPESRLESTEHGLVPKGDGWFVLNAREARWHHGPGRSAICEFEGAFEGEQDFLQLGINLSVLRPARSVGLRALLPRHVIVGAGDAPCLVLAVGARDRSTGPDWGGYTVDEAALRPGAGVEQETTDPKQAYARFTKRWTRAPAGAAPSAMPWRGFAAGLARSRRLWLSALRR